MKITNVYQQFIGHLHFKTSTKVRCVITVPTCSLKTFSKDITSVLNLIYDEIDSYNNKRCCKSFWTIHNNELILKSPESLSKRNKENSLFSFDFSTLYTNIRHDKLDPKSYKI